MRKSPSPEGTAHTPHVPESPTRDERNDMCEDQGSGRLSRTRREVGTGEGSDLSVEEPTGHPWRAHCAVIYLLRYTGGGLDD